MLLIDKVYFWLYASSQPPSGDDACTQIVLIGVYSSNTKQAKPSKFLSVRVDRYNYLSAKNVFGEVAVERKDGGNTNTEKGW